MKMRWEGKGGKDEEGERKRREVRMEVRQTKRGGGLSEEEVGRRRRKREEWEGRKEGMGSRREVRID